MRVKQVVTSKPEVANLLYIRPENNSFFDDEKMATDDEIPNKLSYKTVALEQHGRWGFNGTFCAPIHCQFFIISHVDPLTYSVIPLQAD